MKKLLVSMLSIVLGLLFGFFGVLNSVFSDGASGERLVFIALIIAIYGFLGLLLGFFFPDMHRLATILLVVPGILFLVLFLFSRFYAFILLYMVLLAAATIVSAMLGRHLRGRLRKDR